MTLTIEELHSWLKSREGSRLEFKEAKSGIDSEKLTRYCAALANEGGGHFILGVTDKLPRKIVGSSACQNIEKTKSDLISRLHLRIEISELQVYGARVLVFSVPSRPIGVPIQYDGKYWMRRGEELVSMTPDITFNEKAIRESILNAVSHRDYREAGSIWVRQYPRKITIASPGGFPSGINPSNMLWKQQPRNRRIADVFNKCGLVERAGQGADRIFEESIRQGKPLPDFTHTDEHEVVLTLDGQIQDEHFLRFLEKIGQKQLASFTTEDFLVIDLVHREQPIPPFSSELKSRLRRLIDLGIIESIGRGRGVRHMLCQQYYVLTGKRGVYTRKRGLDKETNKELLLKHIRANAKSGSKFYELSQVLPALSRDQLKRLLKELKAQGRIHPRGKTHASLWFPNIDPILTQF